MLEAAELISAYTEADFLTQKKFKRISPQSSLPKEEIIKSLTPIFILYYRKMLKAYGQ